MMAKHEERHWIPYRAYIYVYVALVALTGLTLLSAALDFGKSSTIVSLAIATTKAGLVLLYFMHLKYEIALFKWTFLAAVVTLGIFLIGAYSDVISR